MRRFSVFSLAAALLFLSSEASAKIWIVDNNPGNKARDFTTLSAAHIGAADGDTLYFAGSTTNYGGATLNKTLTIIGPGFFLNENLGLQAYQQTAKIDGVTFGAGSDSSIIMGMEIVEVLINNASYITIKRNLIQSTRTYLLSIPCCILQSISNIVIEQNYIFNTHTSTGYNCIQIPNGVNTNIVIMNNFIGINSTSPTGGFAIKSGTETDVHIVNNVIRGKVELGNIATFNNNILRDGSFTIVSGTPSNNIGNSTQFGTGNGNQESVDMNTVFELTGSTDAQWKLKADTSPALGAGLGGVDCGMYGGTSAFVMSGIPPLPAIYEFIAPPSGTTTLPVQAKVRSNN